MVEVVICGNIVFCFVVLCCDFFFNNRVEYGMGGIFFGIDKGDIVKGDGL